MFYWTFAVLAVRDRTWALQTYSIWFFSIWNDINYVVAPIINIEMITTAACLPNIYTHVCNALLFVKDKLKTNLLVLLIMYSDYTNSELIHSINKNKNIWTNNVLNVSTGYHSVIYFVSRILDIILLYRLRIVKALSKYDWPQKNDPAGMWSDIQYDTKSWIYWATSLQV